MSRGKKKKTSPLFLSHRQQVLHSRGISDEVIDGAWYRPRYVSFAKGDFATVSRWTPVNELEDKQRQALKGMVSQSSGIIILRRGMSDYDTFFQNGILEKIRLKDPEPQIRFDTPVWCGPKETITYRSWPTSSKRFDIHPAARELIQRRKELWFCLEGSLKADAVLSAGEAVFSVLGVTMWNVPKEEWTTLSRYLTRERSMVHVVPDSDYFTNGQVALNAWRCVSEWRTRGVEADLAVPGSLIKLHGQEKKTGVDDWLAAGMSLRDMTFLPGTVPVPEGLKKNEARLFDHLISRGGWYGHFRVGAAAKELDIDRRTVTRTKDRLVSRGVIGFRAGKVYRDKDKILTAPHEFWVPFEKGIGEPLRASEREALWGIEEAV